MLRNSKHMYRRSGF